ncbi:MAG: hypothetical protein ACLR93_08335 [Alistipes onderdonkii]
MTGRVTAGSLLPAIPLDLLEKWGVAVAFLRGRRSAGSAGVKYLAVFDPAASGTHGCRTLWLAAANTDPRRDVRTEGAALVIDARSKRPGRGDPGRFPNVVTASEATVALVDRRWRNMAWGVCRFAVAALPPPAALRRAQWR